MSWRQRYCWGQRFRQRRHYSISWGRCISGWNLVGCSRGECCRYGWSEAWGDGKYGGEGLQSWSFKRC